MGCADSSQSRKRANSYQESPATDSVSTSESGMETKGGKSSTKRVMKRNRISYVCLACRKRKTRCDRGNPCSKCVALGTECIYMTGESSCTVKQSAPLETRCVASPSPNSAASFLASDASNLNYPAMNNPSPQAGPTLPQLSHMLPQLQPQQKLTGNQTQLSPQFQPIFTANTSDGLRLKRLEDELAYWKNKAINLGQNGGAAIGLLSSTSSSPHTNIFTSASHSTVSFGDKQAGSSHDYQRDIEEYGNFSLSLDDSMRTVSIHDKCKALHPPFGFISLMFRDPHLSAAVTSIYGFTYAHMAEYLGVDVDITFEGTMKFSKECVIEGEKTVLHYFEPALLNQIKHIRTYDPHKQVTIFVYSSGDQIEEKIESEFPPPLKQLLDDIQKLLPKTKAGLLFYLEQFFKCVYPMHPFLDADAFCSCIDRIILYNTNGSTEDGPIWNVNRKTLRKDMEKLAILMVVIQMSHDTLTSSNDETVHQKIQALLSSKPYINCDAWFCFSRRILLLLNATHYSSEDLFCCMLYQRLCYAFSPRDINMFFDQHPILHSAQLLQNAVILGLHKDPTDYKQMLKPGNYATGIINYRRKLWIGLCNIIVQEIGPLGISSGIEYYHKFFFKNLDWVTFMESVNESLDGSNNCEYQHMDLLLRKYQIGLLISKINKSCTDVEPSTVSEILYMISKLESEILQFEQLFECQETLITELKLRDSKLNFKMHNTSRCEIVSLKLVAYSLIHNVLWSFFLKIEANLKKDADLGVYKLHPIIFEMTIYHCLKFANFLLELLSASTEKEIAECRYIIIRNIHQAYIRVGFCLISLLIKLKLALSCLESPNSQLVTVFPAMTRSDQASRLTVLKDMVSVIMNSFYSLVKECSKCKISKNSINFSKSQSFFAYFVQILHLDRILEVCTRFWDYQISGRPIPKKVLKSVAEKWGMEVENPEFGKYKFKTDSSIHLIDAGSWQRIQERLRFLNLQSATGPPLRSDLDPLNTNTPYNDPAGDFNLDLTTFFDLDANLGLPSFSF